MSTNEVKLHPTTPRSHARAFTRMCVRRVYKLRRYVIRAEAKERTRNQELGKIISVLIVDGFLSRYRDVDQAALARFTAASDRSAVVQRRSTVR